MKKIIFAVLLVIGLCGHAQNNGHLIDHYEAYYKQMRLHGDVRGAINALTHLDILDPSQARKDTLAYLYANSGQYRQAISVLGAEHKTTDSDLALQIKAISFKSIGQPHLAIQNYQILFGRKPNANLAYELADLNLQMEKLSDAKTYLDYGLSNAGDNDKQSYYESNPPYQVPLKAAFLYLKALYVYNQDKNNADAAIQTIDEAINLAPNFTLAQQIKEALLGQKEN